MPRTTDNPRKNMAQTMLSDDELKALDDWAWERRIRSRSEAIRQLLQLGLDAAKQREAADADEGETEAG